MTGGDNLDGQLGLGDDKRRSTPFRIDIKDVNKIAGGLNHTVLLKIMELYGLLVIIDLDNWVIVMMMKDRI